MTGNPPPEQWWQAVPGAKSLRADRWWDHKVPPVLATAYVSMLAADRHQDAFPDLEVDLARFVVSVVGIAGLGHVLNDWFDLESDQRAGKHNVVAELGVTRSVALLSVLGLAGALPWFWIAPKPATLGLVAAEVGLLLGYSAPPFRLKERGGWGPLADSGYAFVLPSMIAWSTFQRGHRDTSTALLRCVGAQWSILVGLRSILFHQLDDEVADRASGTTTLVTERGGLGVERAIARVLLPAELAAFTTMALSARRLVPGLLPATAAYALWRSFQVREMWPAGIDDPTPMAAMVSPRSLAFDFGNDFYERWLPLVPLAVLANRSPRRLVLALTHLALFRNGIADLVREAPQIRGAAQGWADRRFTIRDRRSKARRAQSSSARQGGKPGTAAATPTGSCPKADRAFVYVVCGSSQHVRTLHRSLEALSAWTDVPAIVVTDRSRNEEPIVAKTVIDVETPAELDHHQASIWLKTSLHRHLPPGMHYCYLDSDVLAVRSGVDGVFDHHVGPVTFAADLTIRQNEVNRFSPWAVDCPCTGMGDSHSCTHLVEAIRDRFNVDVDGSWLHWNGGVFVFDDRSAAFLDEWHERTVAVFDDPYWNTRDQATLITTVWANGLQSQPCLPQEFNFIADLGNYFLGYYPGGRYSLQPGAPRLSPYLLHLYSSSLEDPDWDMEIDVERVVARAMRQRLRDRTVHDSKRLVARAYWRADWLIGHHFLRYVKRAGRRARYEFARW